MSESTVTTPAYSPAKLTFVTTTAMVVGSMVGAGVFSWLIAGTGMLNHAARREVSLALWRRTDGEKEPIHVTS